MTARALSGEKVPFLGAPYGPKRAILEGELVRLEPVDPPRHGAELYAASHLSNAGDGLWNFLPYGPFDNPEDFMTWLAARAESVDPLFFAMCDRVTGTAFGMASFSAIEPLNRSIEIAHIWIGPAMQNSAAGTEALYLLMAHTFDELRYRRLEWKCDALNTASRSAAQRLGFQFEGIFYQHRIVKGRNRDTSWYSLLDYEWPRIRSNFQQWFKAANFDENGKPRCSLRELNSPGRTALED